MEKLEAMASHPPYKASLTAASLQARSASRAAPSAPKRGILTNLKNIEFDVLRRGWSVAGLALGLVVSCSDVEPTPGRATFTNLPHIANSGICESYPPHPSVCEWSQSVDAVLIAKINHVKIYDQEFLDESGNFVREEECFYKNYGLVFEIEVVDMIGNVSHDFFPKEIHMGIWDQFYFGITPLVHDSEWVEVIDVRNEEIKYFKPNTWVGWGVTQTQDRRGNSIWSFFHEMPFVVSEEGLIQFGKADDCYPFKPPSFEGNWEYLKETISACRPLEDNPYREARDFTQTFYKNTYIGICDTNND